MRSKQYKFSIKEPVYKDDKLSKAKTTVFIIALHSFQKILTVISVKHYFENKLRTRVNQEKKLKIQSKDSTL